MKIYNKIIELVNNKKIALKKEIKVVIKEMDKVLSLNLDEYLLDTWKTNLKTLRIGNQSIFTKEKGFYDLYNNIIICKNTKDILTLIHELLHLSSTVKKKEIIYSGLAAYFESGSIGVGLNEGYTEVLIKRLFNKTDDSYILEKNIASLLEEIIGKKTMIKCYFKANIEGLIEELSKYASPKEITEFLTLTDKIYNTEYKKINKDIFTRIIQLLLIWYKNKQKLINNYGSETYIKNINNYVDKLSDFEDEIRYQIEEQQKNNLIH